MLPIISLYQKFDTTNLLFGINTNRVTKFDFTNFPLAKSSMAFVIRQDGNIKNYLWMTFLKPFSNYVWLCTLATYLITRLCLTLAMRFYKKTQSISFLAISYTTNIFLFIIVSSFAAVLYGSLTVPTSKVLYNNIQDLLSDERINLYAIGNLFPYKFIMSAKTDLTRNISQRMQKSPKNGSIIPTDVPKLISNHFNAIIGFHDLLKKEYGPNCTFSVIKIPITISTYFMFRKKSKYV
uniref:Ionotropic glutamate receptor C-terminal domain-containing protein n=1 Tax=Strigamia maritima TaxID=126957 RepID=T1J2E3_STRMM